MAPTKTVGAIPPRWLVIIGGDGGAPSGKHAWQLQSILCKPLVHQFVRLNLKLAVLLTDRL
jgi:hypothetical protein